MALCQQIGMALCLHFSMALWLSFVMALYLGFDIPIYLCVGTVLTPHVYGSVPANWHGSISVLFPSSKPASLWLYASKLVWLDACTLA
jgi:hypothetical protein